MARGANRFTEIVVRVDGLSDRMLAARLEELEQIGLIDRIVEPTTPVSAHPFVLDQDVLYLDDGNVLAAADDDVLTAAGDPDAALGRAQAEGAGHGAQVLVDDAQVHVPHRHAVAGRQDLQRRAQPVDRADADLG